jgi:hypothetical protein
MLVGRTNRRALQQERVNAVLVITNLFFVSFADRFATIALRSGLSLFGQSRQYSAAGGLASYGTSTPDAIRQAGAYVGRILKGEKPADLPILQPTKFDLVINLKTAKTLGLEIPPSLFACADDRSSIASQSIKPALQQCASDELIEQLPQRQPDARDWSGKSHRMRDYFGVFGGARLEARHLRPGKRGETPVL